LNIIHIKDEAPKMEVCSGSLTDEATALLRTNINIKQDNFKHRYPHNAKSGAEEGIKLLNLKAGYRAFQCRL